MLPPRLMPAMMKVPVLRSSPKKDFTEGKPMIYVCLSQKSEASDEFCLLTVSIFLFFSKFSFANNDDQVSKDVDLVFNCFCSHAELIFGAGA